MLEPASHAAASFRLLAAALRQSERGRAERYSFRRDLWIASAAGDTTPVLDQFDRATACDLSTSGFSFFSPHLIRNAEVVVSFGPPANAAIVLTAKVVWQSQVAEDGPRRVKVGCQFVRRL